MIIRTAISRHLRQRLSLNLKRDSRISAGQTSRYKNTRREELTKNRFQSAGVYFISGSCPLLFRAVYDPDSEADQHNGQQAAWDVEHSDLIQQPCR